MTESPYRTASTPTTHAPPKRWYLAGNDVVRTVGGGYIGLAWFVWLVLLSLSFVGEWTARMWSGMSRALVVLVLWTIPWCALCVRRGATPPKGAYVIGGEENDG